MASDSDNANPPVLSASEYEKLVARVFNAMPTNQHLNWGVTTGQIIDARKAGLSPEVYQAYSDMARKMGVLDEEGNPPTVYLYSGKHLLDNTPANLPAAEAAMTQGGRMFIVLKNTSFLTAFNPRQQIAMLGHELAHQRDGETTAEGRVRLAQHRAYYEGEADVIGSGILGSCDPEGLRQALQIAKKIVAKDKITLDNSYPSFDQRDLSLSYLLPAGVCPDKNKNGPGR